MNRKIIESKILHYLHDWDDCGGEHNMPFIMDAYDFRMFSVDSIIENEGITRFQGFIMRKNFVDSNTRHIHYHTLPIEVPKVELFPYIEGYSISGYNAHLSSHIWTIYFKQPMTKEIWDKIFPF